LRNKIKNLYNKCKRNGESDYGIFEFLSTSEVHMSIDAGSSAVAAEVTQAANQATQAALTQGTGAAGGAGVVGNATFTSMGQFQAQYPQLYAAFIQSWALQVCNDAKDQNDELISTIQEGEMQD
jgi:hypothetical protein